MAVFVVRHGQTDWNVQKKIQGRVDTNLNENGEKQAEALGKKLKDEKIDIIICSPLKRAKQTAEIINHSLNCPIVYNDGIIERSFGKFEGKTKADCDMSIWNYNSNVKYENLECMKDFYKRIYGTLDQILDEYKEKNILLVTHGGVSCSINCYFNGIPAEDNIVYLGLENGAIAKYEN